MSPITAQKLSTTPISPSVMTLSPAFAISAEALRARGCGRRRPAEDLRAGDDRGHQAGDLVRLRVAVQLQQAGCSA